MASKNHAMETGRKEEWLVTLPLPIDAAMIVHF